MTAIVLCGGVGSRLKGIAGETPKPLLPVAGQPFLHWLTRWVELQGERDFVFAARHHAEQIVAFAEAEAAARPGCRFAVRIEPEKLDTGGAIAFAARGCGDGLLLAMNGDSITCVSLRPAQEILARDPTLDGCIVGLAMDDAARYGTLEVGGNGLLGGFREKRPGAGLINAGIYLLRASLVGEIPAGPQSIEFDVFPRWLAAGRRIAVAVSRQPFIDIGTPETLAAATEFVDAHRAIFEGSTKLPEVELAEGNISA